MINLRENSKVKIHWKVDSNVYSPEMENDIISLFSHKYNISKDRIKVVPDFFVKDGGDENEIITKLTTDNIQDPNFQKELFLNYLSVNDIKDYDWDFINSLDNEINEKINYSIYEKYRKFSIKWLKWSNFMSYGEGNSFDFSSLSGLVLLNGEPANRSGKTVFAVDLLHYWLFGKPGRRKCLDELFNVMLPEVTQIVVEGCLNIEGQDYIIKRVLKRPSLDKRNGKSKASQKVEYYRKTNDLLEELADYEQMNGESSIQTNKIIKECIGREEDFDLMMCITGTNIDELTSKGAAERGRLFLAWTGLLPLEEKYNIANSMFLEYSKKLKSNIYVREDLKIGNDTCLEAIKSDKVKIGELRKEIDENKNDIVNLRNKRDSLLSQKFDIDKDILNLDIDVSQKNLNDNIKKKEDKQLKYDATNIELENLNRVIGDSVFDSDTYKEMSEQKKSLDGKISKIEAKIENTLNIIKSLKDGEYCPVCNRKYDNVDNTEKIRENEGVLNSLKSQKKECESKVNEIGNELCIMDKLNDSITKRNAKKNELVVLENELLKISNACEAISNNIKKYKENKDGIEKNQKINIEINLIDGNISSKTKTNEDKLIEITRLENDIKDCERTINTNNQLINEIDQESVCVKNYKTYLGMLGKNGISKNILKTILPIINGRIKQKLDGVCDFDINIDMNYRDEVMFRITSNGVTNDISSGSGFEKTVTALVIRNVLAEISTIPKMNFIIFDEILGRVASENYDKIRLLYDRILSDYDFIFHITHNEDILDWHNQIVTVVKGSDGCSRLKDVINVDTANKEVIKKKANSVKN